MADVGRELADKELRKLERKLSREYAQAEKELRKKREEFTKEYQKELKKKKALLEKGELTKERYKQWLEQQALYESWVSEMADYMANEQVNANRRAAEIMNNATPKVYAEAFNFGTFLVEDASGVNTAFELYNVDTVANLITKDPKLLPEANIDIPKDKRWNYQKMKTSLVQSVLQGESVSKMARRLQRVTDMNKTSAVRNARTMFVGAENGGRFDSFQRAIDLGIEMKKMWSATMDSRTRNSHAILDGETVELDEKFSNGLMYPGDPNGAPGEVYNCRCRLSAQLAGFERNNRHIVNGESVTEEQYLEWKQSHVMKSHYEQQHAPNLDYDARVPYLKSIGIDASKAQLASSVVEAYIQNPNSVEGYYDLLDEVVTKLPQYKGKLFRGIVDSQEHEYSVGQTLSDSKVRSWTSNLSVARSYSGSSQFMSDNFWEVSRGQKSVIITTEDSIGASISRFHSGGNKKYHEEVLSTANISYEVTAVEEVVMDGRSIEIVHVKRKVKRKK